MQLIGNDPQKCCLREHYIDIHETCKEQKTNYSNAYDREAEADTKSENSETIRKASNTRCRNCFYLNIALLKTHC